MHVLLPIDTDEDRALTTAKTVAMLPNASGSVEVTILNVAEEVEVQGDALVKSDEWYDEDAYPASVDRAKELLENEGIQTSLRREHADPAATILEVAGEIGADWIIMSGRKRTPVGKVLFGSVSQSVLLQADVPVTLTAGSPTSGEEGDD